MAISLSPEEEEKECSLTVFLLGKKTLIRHSEVSLTNPTGSHDCDLVARESGESDIFHLNSGK